MKPLADSLSVKCRYIMCRARPGERCTRETQDYAASAPPARRPHKVRERDALAVAAHSDPELDRWPFAGAGPCAICGVEGLPAAHRVVDAVAGMLSAGEDPQVVAEDYALTSDAVEAVRLWMGRWPGAWL